MGVAGRVKNGGLERMRWIGRMLEPRAHPAGNAAAERVTRNSHQLNCLASWRERLDVADPKDCQLFSSLPLP